MAHYHRKWVPLFAGPPGAVFENSIFKKALKGLWLGGSRDVPLPELGQRSALPVMRVRPANLGLFQVERVEAFGEPVVDRREQIAGRIALALISAKPRDVQLSDCILRIYRQSASAIAVSVGYWFVFHISAAIFQSAPSFSQMTRYLPTISCGGWLLVLRLNDPTS